MSVWVELHCDLGAPSTGLRACHSHRNNYPGAMARNTQESVIRVLKIIHEEARGLGWLKTGDLWACPYCAGSAQPEAGRDGEDG